MNTPSFRHMGGKARLRQWLVDHFPPAGKSYVEPFVGKGNVFFLASQRLRFDTWELSDVNVDFLTCLQYANLDALPETVTRAEFADWRARAVGVDAIAVLLEPRITFAGKGYRYGYSGSSGTHVGYTRACYLPVCQRAKELCRKAIVIQRPWGQALLYGRDPEDFVYCDPPYLGTKASFENIDHRALIAGLNSLPCRWAISGYLSDEYEAFLDYKLRYEIERNSEIKSSNARKRTAVTECLWTNY